MRKILYSLPDLIGDLLTSHGAKTAWMVFSAISQFLIRIFILRPLIIFCCLVLAVLVTIPVAVFISPSFTPYVLAQGILRVMHLIPRAYAPLYFAGALFELIYLIRRFTVLPDLWPHDAVQGKGR